MQMQKIKSPHLKCLIVQKHAECLIFYFVQRVASRIQIMFHSLTFKRPVMMKKGRLNNYPNSDGFDNQNTTNKPTN